MAVICPARPCALQNAADKTFSEGMVYVFPSLVRFVPKAGQRLEIQVGSVTGQQKSKVNPMLRISAGAVVAMLRFASHEERDEVSAAIVEAQTRKAAADAAAAAAAATPTPSAAGAAAAAGAGAGSQSGSLLTPQVPREQRQSLLLGNRELSTQYQALVVEQKALTEDEFWSSSAMLKVAGVAGKPVSIPRASKRGLANRIVDLHKQSVDQDGKMTNLQMTSEDEQQILSEKPALRQIYEAQVPNIITRAEFWQRYFKFFMAKRAKRLGRASRYKAIQQNISADSAAAVADMVGGNQADDMAYEVSAMFSGLDAPSGMDESARRSFNRRLNPVVDLAAAAEDRLTSDGYGLAHNSARSELDQVQGYAAFSQQLVQDYNVHSAAVMGRDPAAPAGPMRPSSCRAAAAAAAGGQPGSLVGSEMSEEEVAQFKRQAASGLDDLSAPVQQQFEELSVMNPRLYFSNIQQQQQQQQPGGQQPPGTEWTVKQEAAGGGQQQQRQQQDVVRLLQSIDPHALTDQPMAGSVANKVLVELCGGDVADAVRTGGTHSLPDDLKQKTQQQCMLVDELLRHLWSLIPCNTDEKRAKMERIQQALVQRGEVLKELEDSCAPTNKGMLSRLIRPLWAQLDEATTVYNNVQKALRSQAKQRWQPPQ